MKWRQFCAELLACADELGVELVVDPRRDAGRDAPHPTDPGERHGHRARPRGPAQAGAGDLRGSDRDRRGVPGRLRPARRTGRVVLGGRPPLPAAAALPEGDARPARPGRGPARDEHPARRPARGQPRLGAGRRRARRGGRGRRGVRPQPRGEPGRLRAPRGQRRGDRAGVRALPQAAGRRRRSRSSELHAEARRRQRAGSPRPRRARSRRRSRWRWPSGRSAGGRRGRRGPGQRGEDVGDDVRGRGAGAAWRRRCATCRGRAPAAETSASFHCQSLR